MATYVKYVKTSSDPTVYGVTSDGRYVAFSTWDQLLSANGGQAPSISTVSSIPSSTSTTPTTTTTTPTKTSSTSTAAPTSTSVSGGSGGFTQFVKTAGSPTVYGRTSDGKWVAFESEQQFLSSGGSWGSIQTVASAPTGALNYSQWKSPTPATTSITGDANLDGLLGRLDKMIQDQASAGNKFNPNIELTPDIVKQFLDQATSEIEPYYSGQITAIKDKLTTNLTQLQKQYELKKQSEEAQFKSNLNNTRETLAGNGLAYSGFRGQQEQNLQQGENRTLEGLGLATAGQANDMLSAARNAIGSTNVGSVPLPTFNEYGASTSGAGSFSPTRTLNFNDFSAPLTGDLQYNQNRDVQNLTDYLKSQEVNKRVLSF